MATIVDALVVTLGLDTKDVNKGVDNTKKQFDTLAKVAGGALAVVGGIAVFKSAISNYANTALAVGNLSQALGVDMEELQAWQQAAIRAGGSAEGLQASVGSLNDKIKELALTGGGPAREVLGRLGIAAADASGKTKPALAIMKELASHFEALDNSESMALGKKLGLDTGTIMLLQSGRVALDDLIKRQKELGVYTKRDAEIAGAYKDAQADLAQGWQNTAAIAMRLIVPALSFITKGLLALSQWARKNEKLVIGFFAALAAIIAYLLLPVLKRLAIANLAAFAPLIAMGAAAAAVAAIIAALVEDYLVWSEGGASLFGEFWQQLDAVFAKTRELWQAVQPLIAAVVKFGGVLAGIAFDFFVSGVETVLDVVLTFIGILGKLRDFWVAIWNGDFPAALEAFKGIFDAIFGFIFRQIDRFTNFLSESWSSIKSFFGFGDDEEAPEGASINAAAAVPPSAINHSSASNVQSETSIGEININVPSGDPQVIGRAVPGAIENNMSGLAWQVDSGVSL